MPNMLHPCKIYFSVFKARYVTLTFIIVKNPYCNSQNVSPQQKATKQKEIFQLRDSSC